MVRRIFKRLSLLLVFILFFNTTFVYAASKRAATIQIAEGTVYIKKGGGEKKLKAIKGMNLAEGDTLITGADGVATVKLDSDKTIKVAPNTTINIKDLKGTKGTETTTINQIKGITVTKIDDKLKGNASYNQKTPTAIMGVKGTIFSTEQREDQSLFSVVAGQTNVQLIGNPQPPTPLAAGQQFATLSGGIGALAPLDIPRLDPFSIAAYRDYLDSLPSGLSQQISDYIEANPQALQPPPPPAPSNPNTHPQILYSQAPSSPPSSNISGGGSSSSGPGTIVTPPVIPPVIPPINLSAPLTYTNLMFSEYIAQDYKGPEKLSNFLVNLAIESSSTTPDSITINLQNDSREVHLRKDNYHTIAPGTSLILPNEFLDLSKHITLQLNEYIGQTAAGNKHWRKLTDSMETYSSDGISSVIPSITENSAMYTNHSFKIEDMILIELPKNRTTPCIIVRDNGITTASTITVTQDNAIGFGLRDFEEFTFTIDGAGTPLSIELSQSPAEFSAAVIAALTAADLKATYCLKITNISNQPKQLGIDLTLRPDGSSPVNLPSYLDNLGLTASLEDIEGIDEVNLASEQRISLMLTDIQDKLSSGQFRALAPLVSASVALDSNNLLNWKAEDSNPLKNVKNRVIYSNGNSGPYEN
ncbi:MAG: hypothetical protein K0S71_2827 [Clostridia bacterium]|jgi:hypothetical protein|nr:hypothetical protein [Clostridia bacterium]